MTTNYPGLDDAEDATASLTDVRPLVVAAFGVSALLWIVITVFAMASTWTHAALVTGIDSSTTGVVAAGSCPTKPVTTFTVAGFEYQVPGGDCAVAGSPVEVRYAHSDPFVATTNPFDLNLPLAVLCSAVAFLVLWELAALGVRRARGNGPRIVVRPRGGTGRAIMRWVVEFGLLCTVLIFAISGPLMADSQVRVVSRTDATAMGSVTQVMEGKSDKTGATPAEWIDFTVDGTTYTAVKHSADDPVGASVPVRYRADYPASGATGDVTFADLQARIHVPVQITYASWLAVVFWVHFTIRRFLIWWTRTHPDPAKPTKIIWFDDPTDRRPNRAKGSTGMA